MKKRYIITGLSLAVLVAVAGTAQVVTSKLFDEQVQKTVKKINRKGVYVSYENTQNGIFTKQGKVTVRIEPQVKFVGSKKVKSTQFELKTKTRIFPLFTKTVFSAGNEQSSKFINNFKIDEFNLTSIYTKAKLTVATKKDELATITTVVPAIGESKCSISNAKAVLNLNKKGTVIANLKTDYLSCSQPTYIKEKEFEFLKVTKIDITTPLNSIFDKNFNLKSPDYFDFSASNLNLHLPFFNTRIVLSKIDINRMVTKLGDKENLHINTYLGSDGVSNRFNLKGNADRFIQGKATGLKKGNYHVLMQGPAFTQMPMIKSWYNAGFLKQSKYGIETDIEYTVDLGSSVEKIQPLSVNPNVVKLVINGKQTTPTELFMIH